MGEELRVADARARLGDRHRSRETMWRHTIPSSFYKAKCDENSKSWNVEASYFERKLTFKIDAVTGNVSAFKIAETDHEE
jgi:hypothetical protein